MARPGADGCHVVVILLRRENDEKREQCAARWGRVRATRTLALSCFSAEEAMISRSRSGGRSPRLAETPGGGCWRSLCAAHRVASARAWKGCGKKCVRSGVQSRVKRRKLTPHQMTISSAGGAEPCGRRGLNRAAAVRAWSVHGFDCQPGHRWWRRCVEASPLRGCRRGSPAGRAFEPRVRG